jgi:hypothetical protein
VLSELSSNSMLLCLKIDNIDTGVEMYDERLACTVGLTQTQTNSKTNRQPIKWDQSLQKSLYLPRRQGLRGFALWLIN